MKCSCYRYWLESCRLSCLMFKLKRILWILGGLVFAFLCVFVTILVIFLKDDVVRVDKPISLMEARRRGETFPFPDSAHDIRIAGLSHWQQHEFVLRFEAPPSDCTASIPNIFRWHVLESRLQEDYRSESILGSTNLPITTLLLPVSWFDNAEIKHGAYAGTKTSRLWVDEDHGILYYWEPDEIEKGN